MVVGRRVLGLGAVLMGVVGLVFHHGHGLADYAASGLLILAGALINLPGRLGGCAALGLGIFFTLWGVLMTVGRVHDWKQWVIWQDLAEHLAMGMGALIAGSLIPEGRLSAKAAPIALKLFGLCLLVFGISHFVYLKFTAAMVPAWIPPSQTAWAYATGAAQIAAGLAILSGVRAHLAAVLLTAMYVGFGLLVHLPAAIRTPHSHEVWSENAVNLVLAGAAWCAADWLRRKGSRT